MSETRRRHTVDQTDRRDRDTHVVSSLPKTVDASRGSSNLATTPRAGNISSDMRAGRSGWFGACHGSPQHNTRTTRAR